MGPLMIVDFTPFSALAGGALIGLAATLVLLLLGRTAGISGIWSGLVVDRQDVDWRGAFVFGLLTGGGLLLIGLPSSFGVPEGRSLGAIALSGLLVGVGTRMASGCTSGHGVCGLSRLSGRSLAAVLTFMIVGFGAATGLGYAAGGVL